MKRISFICLLLSLNFSFGQKTNYTISAEANALMCPFLSPKLMTALENKGAKDMFKTTDLKLTFYCLPNEKISTEKILELVENIGYDPKQFKIETKEEN